MSWTQQQSDEMLARVGQFIERHVHHSRQLSLLRNTLAGLQTQLKTTELPPFFMVIPLLVFAAIRGDDKKAWSLVVATILLFLGIDILDDVADGDLPPHWKGFKESEINLLGATLLSTLPQIAIAELPAPPQVIASMQKTIAEGLLRMSGGQESDLTLSARTDLTADVVEASVTAKSGEEIALFARLASQLAGAPASVVEHYVTMGREIGTAGQLASDCYDLFQAKSSKDLANGTRTFPIALYLEKKGEPERQYLLELLSKAQKEPSAVEEVRKCLHDSGILRITAFIVELHCQRAKEALSQAKPAGPAAKELYELIDCLSFFPKKNAPFVKGGP